MSRNKVKVARPPIILCLQCPLCSNLVHEATTISECLHTFCRACIYQHLGDNENDCCPICNVNLGCSPLEKLRVDHQLNDVRSKIFPPIERRSIDDNGNIDGDVSSPVRRKERSLSSLGIGTVPSSNPGFVSRRTKPVSRRTPTARDTSSDEDIVYTKAGKVHRKKVFDKDSPQGSSSERGSTKSGESDALERGDIICDDYVRALSTLKREQHSSGKKMPQVLHAIDGASQLGFFLKSQNLETSKRILHERHLHRDRAQTQYSGLMKGRGEVSIDNSPLAQLAEIAVDEARQSSLFKPRTRGPRTARGKGRNDGTKCPAVGGILSWKMMLENIRNEATSQVKKHKSNIQSPLKANSTSKKPPMNKTMDTSVTKFSHSIPTPISNQDKANTGFWFSLEAAEDQSGQCSFPQISSRYLRIKNGKLPVSTVKKYLVKKLDLQSDSEVEIKCRGQPVLGNLPLEKVQNIWLATTTSFELLPALKQLNIAARENRNWPQFMSRPADDCVMVLTYSRKF